MNKIFNQHHEQVERFVKKLTTIYKHRSRRFDPYRRSVSVRSGHNHIRVYVTILNRTIFNLNESKKLVYLIEQYTGDVIDNHSQQVIGNLFDKYNGLEKPIQTHFKLLKENRKMDFDKKIWIGLMEYVRTHTRYSNGSNQINENIVHLRPDVIRSLKSKRLMKQDNTLTKDGLYYVDILLKMGYDYQYVETSAYLNGDQHGERRRA